MSRAYYNENDPFAAAWLRELIKDNLIAQGEVDERSIEDVLPTDLRDFTQCHFFAGIGVWSYALRQAGWPDDRRVWTGSCPCQPFSAAGKRTGTSDERHLWPAWFHLIEQCRPTVVFGEQVASKDGIAWLETVAADMEHQEYSFGAAVTCAAGFSAPFPRHRLYFVGEPVGTRFPRPKYDERAPSCTEPSPEGCSDPVLDAWRQLETRPCTIPHLDGAPLWLAREFLHGYGNALVGPQATAFVESFVESRY